MDLSAFPALVLALAPSQAPAPPKRASEPAAQGATGQQPTARDQERATGSPPAVPASPSQQAQSVATEQQQHEGGKVNYEAVIAYGTVALALFTFFLFLYTARLWRATVNLGKDAKSTADRQSRETAASLAIGKDAAQAALTSADAAKEATQSYKVSERAWVSYAAFDTHKFQGTDLGSGAEVRGVLFSITWVNGGRTPAIRCSMASDHAIVLPPYGKDVPRFNLAPDTSQRETPLLPGVPVNSPRRVIPEADIQRLIDRKCRIFLYGRAEYELVFSQDEGPNSGPQTEVCGEIEFLGNNSQTGQPIFTLSPIGEQNSAR